MSHKHLTLGGEDIFGTLPDGILEMLPDGYKASDTQATSLSHFKSISAATDSESLALKVHASLKLQ